MKIDCEFIEEIILGMADIVLENRILRKQNAELKDYQQKYDNELMKNYKILKLMQRQCYNLH